MEPFDDLTDTNYEVEGSLTWSTDKSVGRRRQPLRPSRVLGAQVVYSGEGSLRLSWWTSGTVSLGSTLDSGSVFSTCRGPISLQYNTIYAPTGTTMRLILVEGDKERASAWMTPRETGDWEEWLIDLADLDNSTGVRGWRLQVDYQESGSALFDNLACTASDASRVFTVPSSWDDALSTGIWDQAFSDGADVAEANTRISLSDGVLSIDYVVEESQSWGGSLFVGHFAPDMSFYNLSNFEALGLRVKVLRAQSNAKRAHLRVVIIEGVGRFNPGTESHFEYYYSFWHVLDRTNDMYIVWPLEGDDSGRSTFYLTGWAGRVGNRVLNVDNIKGIRIDLHVEDEEPGSLTDGLVEISDIRLFDIPNLLDAMSSQVLGSELRNATLWLNAKNITSEPLVSSTEGCAAVKIHQGTEVRPLPGIELELATQFSFAYASCCEECLTLAPRAGKKCHFFKTDVGGDCYIGEVTNGSSIQLVSTQTDRNAFDVFVVTHGDETACLDLCRCEGDVVDCSHSDLSILPRIEPYMPNSTIPVRHLNVSHNPRLAVLEPDKLINFTELETLDIRDTPLRYMTPWGGSVLPSLRRLLFSPTTDIINVILSVDQAFSDICCVPGAPRNLEKLTLYFCEMSLFDIGIDSEYRFNAEYDTGAENFAVTSEPPPHN